MLVFDIRLSDERRSIDHLELAAAAFLPFRGIDLVLII